MEIYQRGQAFIEKDGCLEFDFTKLIIKGQNHQFFYATTKERISASSSVNLNELEMVHIPVENIWPQFSDQFLRAPDQPSPEYYIKEPNLLNYGDAPTTLQTSNQILNEVLVCELLKANPHPNIAAYTGCVVACGRIRGLCFMRYEMTIAERLRKTDDFDKDLCLREIETGVRHLHSLGLVHNDINPTNIMVDGNDRAIIIDFDTCYRNGQKLGHKAGTWGWFMEGTEYAKFANDFYGLSKLRDYMLEQT